MAEPLKKLMRTLEETKNRKSDRVRNRTSVDLVLFFKTSFFLIAIWNMNPCFKLRLWQSSGETWQWARGGVHSGRVATDDRLPELIAYHQNGAMMTNPSVHQHTSIFSRFLMPLARKFLLSLLVLLELAYSPPLGIPTSLHSCLSLRISWRPFQGVPCLSSNVSRDWSQLPPVIYRE